MVGATVIKAVSHPVWHFGQVPNTVTVGVTEQCRGGHGAVVVSAMTQSGWTPHGVSKGQNMGRVTVAV